LEAKKKIRTMFAGPPKPLQTDLKLWIFPKKTTDNKAIKGKNDKNRIASNTSRKRLPASITSVKTSTKDKKTGDLNRLALKNSCCCCCCCSFLSFFLQLKLIVNSIETPSSQSSTAPSSKLINLSQISSMLAK